jgi:hypothetical protein
MLFSVRQHLLGVERLLSRVVAMFVILYFSPELKSSTVAVVENSIMSPILKSDPSSTVTVVSPTDSVSLN